MPTCRSNTNTSIAATLPSYTRFFFLVCFDITFFKPQPSDCCHTLACSLSRPAPCRKNTKFRRAAAVSLAGLLNAFPECCVYEMVAPALLQFAGLAGPRPDGKEDPIMQARAVACLAAAWPRVPSSAPNTVHFEAVRNVQQANAGTLARALSGAVRRKVWSVRVPIFHALAAVVSRSYVVTATPSDRQVATSTIASVLTGSILADVVQAVELGAEDAKYSQVCYHNMYVFTLRHAKYTFGVVRTVV